jgi:gliding motility-associated-like protein
VIKTLKQCISIFILLIATLVSAQPFTKKGDLFGETVFLEGSPRNENDATLCLYSISKGNDLIEIYADKLRWFEGGRSFTKSWVNSNKQPQIIPQNKTTYYFTGGNKSGPEYGYKKLTLNNIYPNIDLIYELLNGELKYSFDLHKDARIEDIQFEISGTDFIESTPENIKISIDSSSWEENSIRLISSENAKKIPRNNCYFHKINNHIFGFDLQNQQLKPPYIIDPFIIKTKVLYGFKTIGYLWNNESNYDVEFDFNGNLFIYGGKGHTNPSIVDSAKKYPFDPRYNNYYKVAKYSKAGNLIWVFKGYDTSAKYLQNSFSTGITVEKSEETLFCNYIPANQFFYSIKLNHLIQLNKNGAFNNFSPETKYDFTKIGIYNTVLPFSSNSNSKIIGLGGLNDTGTNKGLFEYNKDSSSRYLDVVKITKPFSNGPRNGPVLCGINSNNSLYNVFYSWSGKYDIWIQKLASNYSEIWRSDSFLITPYRILGGFIAENTNFSSVTANLLGCNDSILVYFDGHTFKVYKTSNGKKIYQDTLKNKKSELTYGVAVDPCNNIFIAGDSSKIYCYQLKDTLVTLKNTLNIDNKKHRYIFDIEYDPQRKLIYATGDSILASIQNPFSCIDSSMTTVLDSVSSFCWKSIVAGLKKQFSGSVYSFEWTDTTTHKVVRSLDKIGNATDTLANPIDGHVYKLRIMKNKTNLGLFTDLYFNVLKSSKDTQTIHGCQGNSVKVARKMFTANATINDTLTNNVGCDSVITYKIVFHPTFKDTFHYKACVGDTLKFINKFITSSGIYHDTLKSIWQCDSFVLRDVKFFGTTDTQTIHICRNTYFKVGKNTYSKAGFYRDTFQNANQCDSIICTKLIVHNDTTYTLKHQICSTDSIKLAGKYRKLAGIYTDSLHGFWSCDSVIHHQLVVHKTSTDTVKFHLCKGQAVYINGNKYNTPGEFSSELKNQFGCDSLVHYVITQSNMIADFNIDTTDNPMLIFKNKSVGNTKFFWDFGDQTKDSTTKDPTHTYNNDQTHFVRICLSIVDSFGCNDTICQSVEISKLTYWIFNSFSPGSDGYNDIFKIGHKGGNFNYNMMVYNRWGALVYETQNASIKDESKFWNGKVMNSGEDCPEGSYFVIYQLFVNGANHPPKEIHGAVMLIR